MTKTLGWVGTGNTDAYYSFTLTGTTTIDIALSGLSQNASIGLSDAAGNYVQDANGNTVFSQSGYSGATAYLQKTLNAGTYYIDVHDGYTPTTYQLSVLAGFPTGGSLASIKAGHAIGTPDLLGTIANSTVAVADAVSNAATNYYSFTLSNPQMVSLSLTGVSGNDGVRLNLLNSQGNTLSTQYNYSSYGTGMQYDLGTGSYLVSVVDTGSGTPYNLAIAGSALPTPVGGSSTVLAKSMGTPTTTPTAVTDFVGGTDSNHYFSFNVTTPTTVTVSLSGVTSSAYLYIDNSSWGSASLSGNESITQNYSVGTHTIEVSYNGNPNWAGTPFTLSVNSGLPTVGSQGHVIAGSSLPSSYSLGSLNAAGNAGVTVADWFGSTNTDNYYSFTLSAGSAVDIHVSGITNSNAYEYTYLVDANNNGIASVLSSSTRNGDMIQDLAAGTYYIHVAGSSNASSGYSLSASASVLPVSGGGSLSSAQSLNLSALSVSDALSAFQSGQLSSPATVVDTTANVQSGLDALQQLAAAGDLKSVTLSDGGVVPTLSVSASQLSSDKGVLQSVTNANLIFSVTTNGTSQTITGIAGHGNIVNFSGNASSYTVTPSGDGSSFTISNGTISDHVSGVTALQFGNYLDFVASLTPAVAGAVSSAQVTDLYAAVFGRTPDVAGLAYYESLAAQNPGLTISNFAQSFLASQEYTSNAAHNYATTTAGDTQFINDTYTNLLHRSPAAGDAAWYIANVITPFLAGLTPGTSAYISAEAAAHATVLANFSQSAEFLGNVQITAAHLADAQHWLILV